MCKLVHEKYRKVQMVKFYEVPTQVVNFTAILNMKLHIIKAKACFNSQFM